MKYEVRNCCSTDNPEYLCDKCKAKLGLARASSQVRKTDAEWRDYFGRQLQGYGSVQPDAPPDPYRAATLVVTPDLDPNYDPYGMPPDGYAIAVAQMKKETR